METERESSWKVVATSNFNLETFNEYFLDHAVRSHEEAVRIAEMLNDIGDVNGSVFWAVKPDGYKLCEVVR